MHIGMGKKGRFFLKILLHYYYIYENKICSTAKNDQSGQMPRPIRVFAGRTGHFVGFIMRRLISFCAFEGPLPTHSKGILSHDMAEKKKKKKRQNLLIDIYLT